MATLKSIIKDLETISSNQTVYNYFGEGNVWEIDSKEITYPAIWVDAETNSHTISNNTKKITLNIFFFDLVYNDESNELDIKSDTLESVNDFVNFLQNHRDDYDFFVEDNQYTAQTFTEKWNDSVAGTMLTITLTMKSTGDYCKNIFSV